MKKNPKPSYPPKYNDGDRIKLIMKVNRGAERFDQGRVLTIKNFLYEEELLYEGIGEIHTRHLYAVKETNVGFYDIEMIPTEELSPEEKKERMKSIIRRLNELKSNMNDLPKERRYFGKTKNRAFADDVKYLETVAVKMEVKLKGHLYEGLESDQMAEIQRIIKRWFSDGIN